MNNEKSIQTRNRAKAAKDPLKGAPGHVETPEIAAAAQAADAPVAAQKPLKVRKANEEIAEQNHEASHPSNVDEVLAQLSSTFGEGNVAKLREMIGSKAADAEAKFMETVRSLMSSLPKDFSLPSFSAITNRPGTSAAAVATGVGALFLLREYLTRDTSAPTKPKAPKKKVAGSSRNPSSKAAAAPAPKMSAAKGSKSSASKGKATSKKSTAAKGSKAKTAQKPTSKKGKR